MATSRFVEPLESRRLLAATYYVNNAGNDSADGRSAQTAWKTIARVNGKNWNPGDQVLFAGGQTFSAVGATGANVLNNPGFESGLTGWSDTLGTSAGNSGVTDAAHSGAGALVINGSGAGTRGQDVTASIAGNQAYRVRAWTRTENPGTGIRRVGVTFTLNGETVATFYRGYRNIDWHETNWAFVAPGSFDKAVLWITRSGDTSTVYADDFVLQKLPNALVFDSTDSGTVEYPFIVGSYGSGKATIAAGDGIGLWGGNV
ncbi:MAG: hypothetical protein ABIP55_01655, partial [Tepidisphaeraceae bacterium]